MNRKQIVTLFILVALLLSYAPIVGLGGMTVMAHGANEAVADCILTSTDRIDQSGVSPAPTYAGVWDTFAPASLAQQAADCPADMISYWRLDETSGSTFDDYYDHLDGACAGTCPSPTTDGKVNGGQVFDRSLQTGIDVPADASFNWGASDSFSIEYWMKGIPGLTCAGSGVGDNEVIVGRDDSGTDLHWWFGCVNTTGYAHFQLGDTSGDGIALDGPPINDGKWHHLVGVRDGVSGVNRLYVDGVEVDSVSKTYSAGFDSATAALNLGWLDLPEYYHFNGTLDDVALYDRALSEREIKTHYYLARGYCDACDTPVRIMPLGDSITVGNASGVAPDDDAAHWVSFRKDLWESLGAAGYNVDFVGSQTHGDAFDPPFDSDHAGYGGMTDDWIADRVYGYLVDTPADVVLLHIGTNGLNSSPDDVEYLLDEIDRYSEDVTVILARIINHRDGSSTTTAFNDNVEAMALVRIANGDKIIIVDMEDGAGIVYGQAPGSGDMWDNLHPYETGYAKMADVWLNGDSYGSDGLVDFLPVCAPDPMITSDPVTEATVGWLYSYDVDASGNPPPTYTLTVFPAGMTIDENTGLIEWTPAATGDYDVTVEATNSEGTDTQPFTITVAEAPACPADMTHYWKLDETTGPPYEDFYGTNDATCTNCPATAMGIVNGGQLFDGSGDEVNVDDDDTFDWSNSQSFSIEFWAQTTSDCSGNEVIVGRDDGGATPLHWWVGCADWLGDSAIFILIDNDGRQTGEVDHWPQSSGPMNDGAWHHIVAVRDAAENEIRLYVDGVEEDSSSATYSAGFDAPIPTALNMGHLEGVYNYDGTLDEVALYDRALSAGEIQQHHDNGLAGLGYCQAGAVAPTITSTPVTAAIVGLPYSYDVEATGNPTPTYALTVFPTGMTIDENTGEISWTPAATGDYDVTVEAVNSEGSDTQPFVITVAEAGPCPADMTSYWNLDETSGSIYYDSYDGNDGACAGTCPSPTTDGKVNGGQVFDRSLQTGIDVPADASFNWGASDSFSIEYWMKGIPGTTCAGSGVGNNEVIVGRDDSGTDLHWWFGCVNTTGYAHFQLGDTSGDAAALDGPPINDGKWHHLVGVRDGVSGVNRLYVDGVEVDSVSKTYSAGFDSATAALNLGWLDLPQYYHFNGTLDDVALYDRALSEREIKTHYYLARGYCDACDSPVRIMPLGDSITVGNASGVVPDDDAAHWVSFRKYLWESLGVAGYNVDFVGSQTHGDAFDPPFDSDHAGYGGMTDDWIADRVYGYLVDTPADVVLLHIGTNGLNSSPDDVEDLLDEIDRYSEDVTVILARIINRRDGSSTTTAFNDNVEAMALVRIANGDKIIIVDMEDGAGIVYGQAPGSGDMWDNLHPYETGYAKMADVWLNGDSYGSDGLDDFLPVCAPDPMITSDPVTEATVGWLYTYDVEATGNPVPTYTLTTSPAGMTIDEGTGLIEWMPAAVGTVDVTVEAINSVGSDTQPFTINVAAAPACPADMTHYWKMDETTGSPYEDFYGTNDATCTNCPAATTGMVNGGQLFDGSGDEVNVDDDDTFDWSNSQSFSIEFWARTTSDCSGNEVIVGRDDGGATPLHWWVGCANWLGDSAVFILMDNGDTQIVDHWPQSSNPMNDGLWHHIVAVRDAAENEIRLYVDGVEEDSSSATYSAGFDAPIPTALNLGHLESGYNYDGTLDEVALYDRALSAAEVQGHYNDGIGRGYCEMYAPEIVSTAVTAATVGWPYSYDVEASGNPVPTYTLTTSPAGMTIDEGTGEISWTPAAAGDYDVTVEATNSEGSDTQPFTITVTEAPVCPTDMTHYWKLDETAGAPYEDSYGSNDAICTNCPAATTGIVNGAQQFDGDNDEVNVADDDTFDWSNSQSFSIEFWARTTSDCSGNEVIVGREDGATSLHWWVGCADWLGDSAVFILVDNGGTQTVDHWPRSNSPMNDGAWHHFVAVRDAAENEIHLYVDGAEEDSSSATYSAGFEASSTALNMGHLMSGFNFDGTLDEVALYDRTLSAAEIQGHYNAGTGKSYCETYAPEIVSTAVTRANIGCLYTYDVDASGNPPPTYMLTSAPTGMTIDENTGLISWTPDAAGDYDVTVEASNLEGTDDQSFVVEVKTCPCSINAYYKLDETASPYTDFLGGSDATCTDCPAATTGIVNGAQQFDGSDDARVPDNDQFEWNNDDSFSIEFWMKDGACTSTEVIIGRNGTNLHWWVGPVSSGHINFGLLDSDDVYRGTEGTSTVTNDEWHHIVAVRDENTNENRIYVDGVKENWVTYDYQGDFKGDGELDIGHLDLGYRYEGIVDEVAIYDRALTDAEIQQHHQNGLAGLGYCEAPIEISLETGWNLVSLPLIQPSTAITEVLSSINGNYDLVYVWDGQTQQWRLYDVSAPPYANTLTDLDHTLGFWIHMTNADMLEVAGSVPTATDINLYSAGSGWNLVGYPSAVNRDLPGVLQDHGVGTDFSLVYAYHANDPTDPWKLFDRTAPPYSNDLFYLSPSWGYWIKASADHTWDVAYSAP